jgi:exodeoxyribonuclease-5
MRHDNQILTLATLLRSIADHPFPSVTLENDHSEDGSGVWKLTRPAFKKALYEAALAGEFADGSSNKVLAWRNVQVGEYNNLIRSGIFGAAAEPGMYLIGDRIVATAPCMAGDAPLLMTDEEAIVEGVAQCKHPLYPSYSAQELTCRSEENKVIRLLVLHPSSQQKFDEDSAKKAADARTSPKLWQAFWKHQELFHAVKYAYALTVHRSQGSTYDTVWVDYQDILKNRNRKEAFQCLYVACSRPTTKLMLA